MINIFCKVTAPSTQEAITGAVIEQFTYYPSTLVMEMTGLTMTLVSLVESSVSV